jgi:hypothetical protein
MHNLGRQALKQDVPSCQINVSSFMPNKREDLFGIWGVLLHAWVDKTWLHIPDWILIMAFYVYMMVFVKINGFSL